MIMLTTLTTKVENEIVDMLMIYSIGTYSTRHIDIIR